MKPISDVRINKTVQRLQAKFAEINDASGAYSHNDELQNLISQLGKLSPALAPMLGNITPPATERLHMIRAAVGSQIRMIPVEDVLYFEATDKYINVVTAEQAVLIRMSLRELSAQLDPCYFLAGTSQLYRQHQAA